ncbi:MAG: D-alanine--D-alanine ligase [Planctomycetaceae bacterium]
MKIGLTYDLRDEYLAAGHDEEAIRREFDRAADTIDSISRMPSALLAMKPIASVMRQLVARLAAGDRWDLVFNICEGMHGIARAAGAVALLEAHEIPYTFADPVVMAVCLHKGLTKTLVEKAGLPTPVLPSLNRSLDVEKVDLPYPLSVKPIAEGTGMWISPASCISSTNELREVCASLLARFRQPVLVEHIFVRREFTVGILGTGVEARVLGTLEIVLLSNAEPGAYSYINKERCEELVYYDLVSSLNDPEVAEAERTALESWKAFEGLAMEVALTCVLDGNGQLEFHRSESARGIAS